MKIYKSKIDIPYLILPMCFPFVVLLKQIKTGDLHIFLPTIIGISVIYILLYKYTKYTIENDSLNIKGGFLINKDIQVKSITEISKIRNLFRRSFLTNPFLTSKGLVIHYGDNKTILISPNDNKEFVKDIQHINPNILVSLD